MSPLPVRFAGACVSFIWTLKKGFRCCSFTPLTSKQNITQRETLGTFTFPKACLEFRTEASGTHCPHSDRLANKVGSRCLSNFASKRKVVRSAYNPLRAVLTWQILGVGWMNGGGEGILLCFSISLYMDLVHPSYCRDINTGFNCRFCTDQSISCEFSSSLCWEGLLSPSVFLEDVERNGTVWSHQIMEAQQDQSLDGQPSRKTLKREAAVNPLSLIPGFANPAGLPEIGWDLTALYSWASPCFFWGAR